MVRRDAPAPAAGGSSTGRSREARTVEERGRERQSLLFGAYQGAVYRTQTYLVMTHDDAKGRVTLENGGAKVTWPNVAKQPIFKTAAAAAVRVGVSDGTPSAAPTTTGSQPVDPSVPPTRGIATARADEVLETAGGTR